MTASMKVVLFCGGLGLRMREHGADVPKPMAMIGDRPLLWHVMRYYAHFGHTDFVLCLGHGAAAVKRYFLDYDETLSNDFALTGRNRQPQLFSTDITDWNITFIDTGLDATVGERLMRVREQVQDQEMFLANYADTLTDAPLPALISSFRRGTAAVGLLAVPPASTHHIVELGPDGRVTGISASRSRPEWENGGYFIMRPEVFDALRAGEDLVPHALNRLVAQAKVTAHRYAGFWRAVDTFKDRAEMEQLYAQGRCPWMLWDDRRRDTALHTRLPHRNGRVERPRLGPEAVAG
jgi:glucose-1-phosphate cytidylyltransferase